MASALSYLHSNGIVHGDIKGNNVLASPNGDALLCDFGLAKLVGSQTSGSRRGSGALRWESPELLDGQTKSTASDIWAFGMTIYEVCVEFSPKATLSTISSPSDPKRERTLPRSTVGVLNCDGNRVLCPTTPPP
jgi:serine/threonine protein kinase